MLHNKACVFTVAERLLSLVAIFSLAICLDPQAAELTPALQADGVIDVKEAIQGAIQGENGEVVQIVTSVATWTPRRLSDTAEIPDAGFIWHESEVDKQSRLGDFFSLFAFVVLFFLIFRGYW